MIAGCYKIPNIHVDVTAIYTNTAMVDAYRGAGRPEAAYVIERVCDAVAAATGVDPAEVRRKNFIQPDDFPYDTGVGMLPYDTGNYERALDKALEQVGYQGLRAEQKRRIDAGEQKLLGIGLSSYVEVCGVAPSKWIGLPGEGWGAGLWESANIRVQLTGKTVVTTGSLPHGQGHETTFAQLVSDKLGIPYDDIQIEHSDSLGTPFGFGSYGSRSLTVGGTAIYKSTDKIIDKVKKLGAHMLEASEEDVEFENGKVFVKGSPDAAKTIQEIALAAHVAYDLPEGMEPFLDETTYYDPPNCTFPFGTHVCVVEVDKESGEIESGQISCGRRCRQCYQSIDRRWSTPWRHRAGAGAGALRGRVLRRRWPAPDRVALRLRDSQGEPGSQVRARQHGDAKSGQSDGSQGRGRGRNDRIDASRRECGGRCGAAPRRREYSDADDPGANLGGHERGTIAAYWTRRKRPRSQQGKVSKGCIHHSSSTFDRPVSMRQSRFLPKIRMPRCWLAVIR